MATQQQPKKPVANRAAGRMYTTRATLAGASCWLSTEVAGARTVAEWQEVAALARDLAAGCEAMAGAQARLDAIHTHNDDQ